MRNVPCDGVWTAVDPSKKIGIVLQQLLEGSSGHCLLGWLSKEQLGVLRCERNLHTLDDTSSVAARAGCAVVSGTVGGKSMGPKPLPEEQVRTTS